MVIAFVEDAISAFLLYQDAKGSLNIKSARLHMVGDTLATFGVLIGGLCVILWDIYIVDPIITALIAGYVLVHSYLEIRKAIRILMESAPKDFDFDQMVKKALVNFQFGFQARLNSDFTASASKERS